MTTTSNRKLVVRLEPVPASRPRIRTMKLKSGSTIATAYYAGNYKTFLKDAETAIPQPEDPMLGNLRVTVHCWASKPKTTKRLNPRGDVDNYVKGILDAMTKKGYWGDDDQIVDLRVMKCWSQPGYVPGFSVEIELLGREYAALQPRALREGVA